MSMKVLFETSLTDIKDSDIEGIGTLRTDEKGIVHRWVENVGSTALAAGSACCYPATDASASPASYKKRVQTALAADISADCMAGIAMAALAASGATTSKYGWVQVQGFYSAAAVALNAVSDVAVLAGDHLMVTSAMGTLDRRVASADASTEAFDTIKVNICIALNGVTSTAATTSAVIPVEVHCLN